MRQILQFFKVTWMLLWRSQLIIFVFRVPVDHGLSQLACIVVAALMVFLFQTTINIFPLIRLIRLKNPLRLVLLAEDEIAADFGHADYFSPVSADSNPDYRSIISKASRAGVMTGYEPRRLEHIRNVYSPRMFGTPGAGLSSASHMSTESISLGQRGEMNFAKALMITDHQGTIKYDSRDGLLDDVYTFWSVAMPSPWRPYERDEYLTTDIDVVIVSGEYMVLVDTKFYVSGDVTYTNYADRLYCHDNQTGEQIGSYRDMSKNMEIAVERFTEHYPEMTVMALVVMMPTDNGAAVLNDVCWPGDIPAVTLNEALRRIARLPSARHIDPYVKDNLIELVQN